MRKVLSSPGEFRSGLRSAVLDPKHDCVGIVAERISELREHTKGDEAAFHRIINSSIEEIAVAASSIKANDAKEYSTLVHNVISAVGLLFEASLKDEKVGYALTEGLRMWQTKDIEQSFRNYRSMTKLRR